MTIFKADPVAKIGRDVNAELKKFKPRKDFLSYYNRWADSFKRKNYPYFRCPECLKYIWGDNSILQKHNLEVHVRDRVINKDKGWKFVPDATGRNTRVI